MKILKNRVKKTKKFLRKYLAIKLIRILTGKTHRQINLQRLRKVQIWAFGLLVHRIISLKDVLKLKQNFQKRKVVTSKTKFFGIGPFCARHSICLNIAF